MFFDRDGTIVVDNGYVHRPEDLVPPGAVEAVKRVNDLGSYAFLVTNQAGVARGLFSESDVNAFNAELQRRLRREAPISTTCALSLSPGRHVEPIAATRTGASPDPACCST